MTMGTRSKGKPAYVLGTGLSHDGSACLLRDGQVAVAIEKERVTRVKHDGGNDTAAIRYCLETEGIAIEDLAVIVQNGIFGDFSRGNSFFGDAPRLLRDDLPVPVVTISHHQAHAYSAIGMCPFPDAAVLVIDGCGNALDECTDLQPADALPFAVDDDVRHLYFEKDSYYLCQDGRMRTVFKDFSPWTNVYKKTCPMMLNNVTRHSIGGVYASASHYCVRGTADLGKLMGLAPYGRDGVFRKRIFELRDGRLFVDPDWMRGFDRPARNDEDFKQDFQYYADIACWVQREVERALLYLVEARYGMCPAPDLAYAGGVALNAVANARIVQQSKFRRIYMVPAAGDNGIALGCAFYGWLEVLGRERVLHSGSTCFGRSYGNPRVAAALRPVEEAASGTADPVRPDSDPVERAARLLAEGKVVAWFQGGSEFGPRALGRRSILADPRKPGVVDLINARVKRREEFRPFAPSVLQEDASTCFECDIESPYMILVAQVREPWREVLRSVTHRDGSARIQTVTPSWNPRYHQLLTAFKRLTGLPVLLNTSFNRKGMPIVETPEEAIRFFREADGLDALVVEDFVLEKAAADVWNPNDERHVAVAQLTATTS